MRWVDSCVGRLGLVAALTLNWGLAAMAQEAVAQVDAVTIRKGSGSHHKASFDGQHLTMQNMPLSWLIQLAYGLPGAVRIAGPDWVNSKGYDIDATVPVGTPGVPRPTSATSASQPALIALLGRQMQMRAHVEQRQEPGFALMPEGAGPKLRPARGAAGDVTPGGRSGILVGHAGTMAMLATSLSLYGPGMVFDETQLKGQFDFTLVWNPQVNTSVTPITEGNPNLGKTFAEQCLRGQTGCVFDSNVPALRQALEEQLGLTLLPMHYPVSVIVIDRIDMPEAR